MSTASGNHLTPTTLYSNRLGDLPLARSHLSLQITQHPAAFAADPETEYSPLEAPALPFSSSASPRKSRTRSTGSNGRPTGSTLLTRPHSTTSVPSLAIHSSPSLSPSTPSSDSTDSLPTTLSRRDMHGRGLSDAQEELLVEAQNDRYDGKDANPYAWERPLDSVNRHSRMLDTSPLPTTSDPNGRRVSRLPPGVQMLDPFGFNLAADVSPYDLALNASSPAATPGVLSPSRSPVRASFLQPQLTSTTTASSSSRGHSHFPSSSSIASNLSNASTAATTPTLQPWTKPRAASAGEVYQLNSRAQIKSGLLGPPVVQRGSSSRSRLSKLSGEIDDETMSIASTASKSQLPAFVPADSDYLNSKLYARTIKAQKALEKERLKAASKGKMSRYDSEAAKSTSSLAVPRSSMDTGRPASVMSVASAGKIRAGRRSLGWFKSSSEVALSPPTPDPSPPASSLPTSRSSTALPLGPRSTMASDLPPSPNLVPSQALRSTTYSSGYLREARESVAAQKGPPMASRQTSGSSSNSSGGEELARPGPIPHRKSRASPSSSFQHSPTIRESSPPRASADDALQPQPSALPPPILSTQIRPSRQSPLDAGTRSHSTTPTPAGPSESASRAQDRSSVSTAVNPIRASTPTTNPSAPRTSSSPTKRSFPNEVASGSSTTGPPSASLPPPPSLAPKQLARTSEVPVGSAPPSFDPSRPRGTPAQASVIPPPLLTADASLANNPEVGVKRRKSSLGLLFGGGRSRKNSTNSNSTPSPTSPAGNERMRMTRKTEERAKVEAKPAVKEKVKDKVKESFFGRVKRPDIPEPKKPTSPAPASNHASTSRPRISGPPSSAAISAQRPSASRLPPGAQPPTPHYSQFTAPPHELVESNSQAPSRSRQAPAADHGTRAPDSSSSTSTTFSTLSSNSSTLPATPSSGRSSNGLSKSVNGTTPKANGGGAFSNFFGRNRTKSLVGGGGATTPQKLSRSKNATPTPDDERKHVPVLPSRGNFMTPLTTKKPLRAGPPQAFPGVENYAPPSSNTNELVAHRGYPTYA